MDYIGRYEYVCNAGVFPFSSDSAALGAFATVRKNMRVCDLGTGSAALLLLLAAREPSIHLHGVELDPAAAENARENLQRNGLAGQIVTGDLRETQPFGGQFDLVVSNPPYFPVDSGKIKNSARSELTCTLETLCASAARLVRSGGRFAIVHRTERLVDLLCILRSCELEPKRLKFLSHSAGHAPWAVLIECVRQGGVGITIEEG